MAFRDDWVQSGDASVFLVGIGGQVKKILKHLGLWEIKQRPPPKATGPQKTSEYSIDYFVSQLPSSDNWLYVDPQYPETYAA